MITLITGTPGSGKTAWVVAELQKLSGRRVFVDGITDLRLPHEPAGDLDQWHTWAPDGALIVVDEVQRIWRPRATGAKVPEAIAQLETHRHRGIDFWLITQHPNLVDANIRRLISRHVHLVVTWAGRFQYEWPECNAAPDSKRGSAIKRPYKLPSAIFDSYRSASVHTKVVKRPPLVVYGLVAAVVVAIAIGWRVWYRVDDLTSSADPAPVDAATVPTQVGGGTVAVSKTGVDTFDFRPRLAGRPETAPAYDGVREVRDFPRLAGCMRSAARGCRCFTQQASAYPVPDSVCDAVVRGDVFDPYVQPRAVDPPSTEHEQSDLEAT